MMVGHKNSSLLNFLFCALNVIETNTVVIVMDSWYTFINNYIYKKICRPCIAYEVLYKSIEMKIIIKQVSIKGIHNLHFLLILLVINDNFYPNMSVLKPKRRFAVIKGKLYINCQRCNLVSLLQLLSVRFILI